MAGEAKVVQQLSEEAADELVKGVRQLKSSRKLKKLAKEVGVSTEALEKVASKGTAALEGLGKKLDDLQLGLDSILNRPSKKPPAVSPEFAKEEIAREKGFILASPPPPQGMNGPRGGPLVIAQTQAVGPRTFFASETIDPVTRAPMSSETALVPAGARKIQEYPTVPFGRAPKPIEEPFPTKAQIRELKTKEAAVAGRKGELETTAPGTAAEAEYADLAEAGIPFNLNIAKEAKRAAKRAGLGLGVAGIASGFSKQADAPTAIAAAQVDKIDDVKGLADKAEAQGAVTPEQKAVAEQQIAQVAKASESLEKMLLKEYQRDKARIELMQLTETIMNGLVTAIGANALLNRGSPYAVDFSKGPKTDWAGEFDRLQKDFNTQMNALNEKYKLEAQEKREAERAARQESQFQQSQALKREQMEARQGQAVQTAAQKQAEKKNKLEADATGIIEKIAAFDPEKDVSKMSTSRGQLYKVTKQLFNSEELKQIEARTTELSKESESKIRAFFRSIGLASQEKTPKEYANLTNAYAQAVREKLLPEGQQAAPAAAPSDAEAKRRRLEELRAKKSGG
jgi:hypothetical protein